MRISKAPARPIRRALRQRVLDTCGIATAFAFLPELAMVNARAIIVPHPGWIAVLVLAARYGGSGLFTGLISAAAAASLATVVAGAGLESLWNRLGSGPDLTALAACLLVSWVGSRHLRSQADLEEQLGALRDRAAEADITIETLRNAVAKLRARADRTSTSLSFLRDVAARLEGEDPIAAAEAATELATVRTGAHAAAIEAGPNGFRRLLAIRDARGPEAFAPLAPTSADVSVLIRNGEDRVGAIALWGVPGSALDEATAHDLDVIASWCAPAVARVAWRSDAAAERSSGAL